jgi:uncharacterized membrane protein YccC
MAVKIERPANEAALERELDQALEATFPASDPVAVDSAEAHAARRNTQLDKDASVLAHIQRLANEEHRLFERGELDPEETHRLAALQTELDQCWDFLRQRRALREFGGDPSQARARDANVVKKYIG